LSLVPVLERPRLVLHALVSVAAKGDLVEHSQALLQLRLGPKTSALAQQLMVLRQARQQV
jgi:hypothetical protein